VNILINAPHLKEGFDVTDRRTSFGKGVLTGRQGKSEVQTQKINRKKSNRSSGNKGLIFAPHPHRGISIKRSLRWAYQMFV